MTVAKMVVAFDDQEYVLDEERIDFFTVQTSSIGDLVLSPSMIWIMILRRLQ